MFCNAIVTKYDGYMILTLYYDHMILILSFTSNQILNIFYSKILYALFSAFDLFCYYYKHLIIVILIYFYNNLNIIYFCIDLNTTSYILALALFRAKILYIFQSHCLIAGLQKKTTYRSVLF